MRRVRHRLRPPEPFSDTCSPNGPNGPFSLHFVAAADARSHQHETRLSGHGRGSGTGGLGLAVLWSGAVGLSRAEPGREARSYSEVEAGMIQHLDNFVMQVPSPAADG